MSRDIENLSRNDVGAIVAFLQRRMEVNDPQVDRAFLVDALIRQRCATGSKDTAELMSYEVDHVIPIDRAARLRGRSGTRSR